MLGLFSVFLLSVVGAADMTAPTNDTMWNTTTVTITANYTNVTDVTDPLEANTVCYHNATGTWVSAGTETIQLAPTDAGNVTIAVTLTSALDSIGIAVNCTIGNATDSTNTGFNTNITFDITAPTVTLTVPLSSQSYGRPIDYMCTYSDTIDGSPTTSFNVSHPSDDPSNLVSTSLTIGSSDFLQFIDTDWEGDFTFACYARDYVGNIGSKTSTTSIGPLGRVIRTGGDLGSGFSGQNLLLIVVAMAVIYFISQRK